MANADNPARGKNFEDVVRRFFERSGLRLEKDFSVDVVVSAVHPTLQPYTRVVIELARETSYTIGRVEEEILVTFDQPPDGPVIFPS